MAWPSPSSRTGPGPRPCPSPRARTSSSSSPRTPLGARRLRRGRGRGACPPPRPRPDQPLNVGANPFVVQATDTAGNVATSSVVVTYSPLLYAVQKSYNTTIWAVVAVVLLVVGFLVGMMMAKGRPPEEPP